MTQAATTPAADDALRAVPAEVAGATRAMFFTSTSALPMLRGPRVAYSPEDDAGGGDSLEAEAPLEGEEPDAEADDGGELELDDEGNPIEPAEDLDEIEYADGKKFKVPRELNRGFLREADYTQKTQALAKERQAFDTERSQHAEMTTALRSQIGAVHALEEQVKKYEAIPWDQLRASDPDEWRELRDDYAATRDRLSEAKQALQKGEAEYQAKITEAESARLAATNAALADPKTGIPGWGEQKMRELVTFAGQHNVSVSELQQFSAEHWKLLNLAAIGAKSQQQQRSVERHKKTQETRPAAPIKGGASAPDLNSTKDIGTWMQRRNAQVAKRSGR